MKYYFYKYNKNLIDPTVEKKSISKQFSCIIWDPSMGFLPPKGVPLFPNLIWVLMHHFGLFSNKLFGLALIFKENNLVHRTLITPRYYKFPFMKRNDIQLGDLWTDPNYRSLGLATFALQTIIKYYTAKVDDIWYVVESSNKVSIKTAVKNNFIIYGEGKRKNRLGMSILGEFVLEEMK